MTTRSRSPAAWVAAVVGLLGVAHSTRAAELSYGVDAGVGYSDNIARESEDELAETIASIGGQLRLDHESKRLNTDVAARLEYRDYLDGTFDSEVVGNVIGNAVLNIVEERFTWTLEDTFGQTTQNQFAAATPANRENVNFLSTGPDLTLPLGSRNDLILSGRYADVHYEDSELGNNRVRGELVLQRELSSASHASMNVTTERVSFDEEQFVDFDNNEAFLNYSLNAARTDLSVDGGITEIVSGGESNDGWLGRLELTRRASTALSVGLELGHDFSDAGNAFAQMQAIQPGSVEPVPVQQTAAPFENNYGAVFARFSRNRTGISVRAAYNEETYDDQPLLDRKSLNFNLNFERHLNATLKGSIGANYSTQEYESLGGKFSDLTATLGLRWNFGRVTSLSVEYQFLDRNDDLNGADYRANELWVRLGYLVGEGAAGGGFGGP